MPSAAARRVLVPLVLPLLAAAGAAFPRQGGPTGAEGVPPAGETPAVEPTSEGSGGAAPAGDAAPAAAAPGESDDSRPSDAAEGLAAPPGKGWTRVDGVLAQAGDDVVRLSDVARLVESNRARVSVSSAAELAQIQQDAVQLLLVRSLEVQAGEDAAAAQAEEIDSYLSRMLSDQRSRVGLVSFTELLAEEGADQRDYEEQMRRNLYGQRFRESEARAYVRPGELRGLYRTLGRSLLGEPPRFQLQTLEVMAAAVGGPREALELAKELRRRALAGEDFSLLVEEYSADRSPNRGLTELQPLDGFPREVAARIEAEPVGSVLPPLPLVSRDEEVGGWMLIRVVARDDGPPLPPFEDRATQESLRSRTSDLRERLALGEAREGLLREAHVWTDPALDLAPPPAP